jgi:hypothetical protein
MSIAHDLGKLCRKHAPEHPDLALLREAGKLEA